MSAKPIKIKTPYGAKNWPYVKRVFDTHQDLIDALQHLCEVERDQDPESRNVHDQTRQQYEKLILKAEGKA